ncbi:MAG: MxaK protein [Gammaproteobacteria bacterium]
MLAGIALNMLLKTRSANRFIANPSAIPQDRSALPPEVIFAQAYDLDKQGKYLDALRLYAQIETVSGPLLQERVRYNTGSTYLRQAAQLWNSKGVWEAKQIHTLLDLAEQSLRKVLERNPRHWQARYNLEYALRIRPPQEQPEENDWQGHKSSVHAIMPGIPAGGP